MIPQYTKEEIIDALYENNIRCEHCKFCDFPIDKTPEGFISKCKRIDHNIIRFAPNIFSGHYTDYNQHICKEFVPNKKYKLLYENWTNYNDYYDYHLKVTGKKPYGDYSFIINEDNTAHYYMKGDDFVNGNIFRNDGKLNVYRKVYATKQKASNGTGYCMLQKLIYEDIDGLNIGSLLK